MTRLNTKQLKAPLMRAFSINAAPMGVDVSSVSVFGCFGNNILSFWVLLTILHCTQESLVNIVFEDSQGFIELLVSIVKQISNPLGNKTRAVLVKIDWHSKQLN